MIRIEIKYEMLVFRSFIFVYTVVINNIAKFHDVGRDTFECRYVEMYVEVNNILITADVLVGLEAFRLESKPLKVSLQYTMETQREVNLYSRLV
jgi:hypothetical protein